MTGPSDPVAGAARCNACGTEVRAGEPFCTRCGEPLSCRHCGQAYQEGDRFCPACGTPKTTGFDSGGATRPASVWDLVLARLRRATLGEFDIKGEIGRGGMAAVYLAHEVALDRKVAIKVMSPTLLAGHGMAERFKQEAITVANLNHQHIITIHAVRQFEDLQYFVMQFVEGCSLETIIKQGGPLPIPAVRALLYHVGSALAHAHGHGVIHRDIKPGNILTDRAGQGLVTDFGIAKVMESPSNTQTGMVVGTPAYMSPEQCQSGKVSWKSDQYSLGVVAYEMVAGRAPFDGPTLTVIHAQVHDEVPSLVARRPDCPPELARAIGRMLAKDPADRFDTMAEAMRALEAMPLLPGDPAFKQIAGLVDDHRDRTSMPTTPISPLLRRTPDGKTVVATEDNAQAATTPLPDATRPTHGTPPAGVPTAISGAAPGPASAEAPTAVSAATRVSRSGPGKISVGSATSAKDGRGGSRRWVWLGLIVVAVGAAAAVAGVRLGIIGGTSASGVVATLPRRVVDPVAALALTPEAATLTLGDTAILIATVTDSAGGNLTGQVLDWSTSDSTVVRVTPQGAVVAAGIGGAVVWARTGPHVDSSLVTVAAVAEAVGSVAVARPAGARRLHPGTRLRLQASVTGIDGTSLGGRAVRWISSNPRVASVDSASGRVTGHRPGQVEISAAVDGKVGIIPLEVTPVPVASVAVTPARVALEEGQAIRLQASARDAGGRPLEGRAARWTSDDESVATVARGLVTGVAAGSTSVRVAVDGKTRVVPVAVAAVALTPATISLHGGNSIVGVGDVVRLGAQVQDERGQVVAGSVSWESRDTTVARVSAEGVVTVLSPGRIWIVATSGALVDSVSLSVPVPAQEQFRSGLIRFLAAVNGRNLEYVGALQHPADDQEQKRSDKFMDMVTQEHWALEVDSLPTAVDSRIDARRAVVDFTAELRWKSPFGARRRREVTFSAGFVRDGAEWRLERMMTAPGTKF